MTTSLKPSDVSDKHVFVVGETDLIAELFVGGLIFVEKASDH